MKRFALVNTACACVAFGLTEVFGPTCLFVSLSFAVVALWSYTLHCCDTWGG